MRDLIKKILLEQINEVRVLNHKNLDSERPLKDSDTIRVYHGFNSYEDAITSLKFGFSGKEKAYRVYSYESNNNPNGLFVTLDLETSKEFTYPRGESGVIVILELSVKVGDLESPVWPDGSYTVQGQMSKNWVDDEDRYINGTLKSREKSKLSDVEFINKSDRPEVTNSLYGSENQALFVGDVNPNMVKAVWVGESGKYGYKPKKLDRVSVKEFLGMFDEHEPKDRNSLQSHKYHSGRKKFFKPNDDINIEDLDRVAIETGYADDGIELIGLLKNEKILKQYFWPKQIEQIKKMGLR